MSKRFLLLSLTLLLMGCHLPKQYLFPLKIIIENNTLCFGLLSEIMNHYEVLYYVGAAIGLREEEGWRVVCQSPS